MSPQNLSVVVHPFRWAVPARQTLRFPLFWRGPARKTTYFQRILTIFVLARFLQFCTVALALRFLWFGAHADLWLSKMLYITYVFLTISLFANMRPSKFLLSPLVLATFSFCIEFLVHRDDPSPPIIATFFQLWL